ncbi:MAG: tRNA modification GTPase [Verrucomicrobiota bacterium]|jgi:tRNA modification GTPase
MHRSIAGSFERPASVKEAGERATPRDTIAAISTPAGEGAIALIRVSGEDALGVAGRIYRGKEKPSEFPSQAQRLGEIFKEERLIDQVMVSVHRAPASYTGEDLVEISCHGGILVTARVLEACFHAGARAARPGEFSERAFLNGKMDLTQAEAVMDLIRARSDLALRSANEQLEGRLGSEIRVIRAQLIEMLAHVEAAIDFPEEDIAPDEGGQLQARLDSVRQKMRDLLATAEQGRILREGVRAVIYGPTNAGKSSLLNRLLGYDRAIVSETPGTTRDTIEEVINLRGIPIRLLDTAGLRDSHDELEREGIARTERSLVTADLLLHVLDRNAPKPVGFDQNPTDRIELVLLNKSDLAEHPDWKGHEALRICCVEEKGLSGLEEAILARISQDHLQPENSLAINARHRDCLRRALDSCELAHATMKAGLAPEYLAVDLRAALRAVGEITGAENVEEILDSLFAQFCIGK